MKSARSHSRPPLRALALTLALVAASPALAAPDGYLGVYLVDEADGKQGALVEEVAPGSPAAAAGLRKGDRVVTCDGKPTPHGKALIAHLLAGSPDQALALRVSRDGWERTLEVRLARKPGQTAPAPRVPGPPAPTERGFLGVFLRDGPAGEAVVDQVTEGSPAAKAGLQVGDAILAVDGKKVADPSGLIEALGSRGPGMKATLTVRRGGAIGRDLQVEVTLGRREAQARTPTPRAEPTRPQPTPAPSERRPGWIGVALLDEDGKGPLKVEDVQASSPAERFGVRPGDTILAVDKTDVRTVEQFSKAMDGKFAGDVVTLRIERDGWRSEVRVTLGARQ